MITARSLPAGAWRKSSYSSSNGGDCLEVADVYPHLVPVRDSKRPTGPALAFAPAAFAAFVSAVRDGEFDPVR
jgi:hypothetical protein